MKKLVSLSIVFEITRRCNLKCRHCLRGDAETVTASPDVRNRVARFVNWFFNKTDVMPFFCFGGGEPMLVAGQIHDIAKQVQGEFMITQQDKKGQIEVFPKQNSVDGYGNQVWLPFAWSGKRGGSRFYGVVSMSKLPDQPESFAYSTLPEELVNCFPSGYAEPQAASNPKPPPNVGESELSFKEWRELAIEHLDPHVIYGEWLTGKMHQNGNFMECRDPESASGDRDPSAGVYTGADRTHERLWFHSFRNEQRTMSVFDFMVERGMVDNFKQAIEWVANEVGIPLPTRIHPSDIHSGSSATPRIKTDGNTILKPQIIVNKRQLSVIAKEIVHAVKEYNEPPSFFSYGGTPFYREDKRMRPLRADNFYYLCGEVADYFETTGDGTVEHATISTKLATAISGHVKKIFPELLGATGIPYFDKEGSVC